MPLYDPTDVEFAPLAERFRWFANVLTFEYGEEDAPEALPDALNWVRLLPLELQLGLDDADCSLAYQSNTSEYAYACTIWDVSGPDDLPWCVFIADAYGLRLLTEYSLLTDEADDADLEAVLERATREVPDRLEQGDFDRTGEPVAIPVWLAQFNEDGV